MGKQERVVFVPEGDCPPDTDQVRRGIQVLAERSPKKIRGDVSCYLVLGYPDLVTQYAFFSDGTVLTTVFLNLVNEILSSAEMEINRGLLPLTLNGCYFRSHEPPGLVKRFKLWHRPTKPRTR